MGKSGQISQLIECLLYEEAHSVVPEFGQLTVVGASVDPFAIDFAVDNVQSVIDKMLHLSGGDVQMAVSKLLQIAKESSPTDESSKMKIKKIKSAVDTLRKSIVS